MSWAWLKSRELRSREREVSRKKNVSICAVEDVKEEINKLSD